MLQASDPQPQTWEPDPTRQALPPSRSKKPPKKKIKQLERRNIIWKAEFEATQN